MTRWIQQLLARVDLEEADLSGANLYGATLAEADLEEADATPRGFATSLQAEKRLQGQMARMVAAERGVALAHRRSDAYLTYRREWRRGWHSPSPQPLLFVYLDKDLRRRLERFCRRH